MLVPGLVDDEISDIISVPSVIQQLPDKKPLALIDNTGKVQAEFEKLQLKVYDRVPELGSAVTV